MLNPFRWPFRTQYAAGFTVCAAMLAYAYYSQFALNVEPCPLCIFQRIAFIAMGLFFLAAALQGPGPAGRRIYALLVLVAAAAGAGVAAYHIWVQHQPPDPMAGCAPGWSYMVDNFPISKVLKMAFSGHADCAVVNWTLFGLSMPFWTLLSYFLIGAGAVWAGFKLRH